MSFLRGLWKARSRSRTARDAQLRRHGKDAGCSKERQEDEGMIVGLKQERPAVKSVRSYYGQQLEEGATDWSWCCGRCDEEGDCEVIYRSRGQRPNNAKSEPFEHMVLERAREEGFYDFGPTLTSEHLGRTPDIGKLNPHTLRRWMIEARRYGPTRSASSPPPTSTRAQGGFREAGADGYLDACLIREPK